jgi:hypothetical protein
VKVSHLVAGALFGFALIFIIRADWIVGLACAAVALIIVDFSKDSR